VTDDDVIISTVPVVFGGVPAFRRPTRGLDAELLGNKAGAEALPYGSNPRAGLIGMVGRGLVGYNQSWGGANGLVK